MIVSDRPLEPLKSLFLVWWQAGERSHLYQNIDLQDFLAVWDEALNRTAIN
jgi:hypothetical protein